VYTEKVSTGYLRILAITSQLMGSVEKPLWHYALVQQNKWNRLRLSIPINARDIVDEFYANNKDPVQCWGGIKTLYPEWWKSEVLVELCSLLCEVCTDKNRLLFPDRLDSMVTDILSGLYGIGVLQPVV
jgi:hypothetical protein